MFMLNLFSVLILSVYIYLVTLKNKELSVTASVCWMVFCQLCIARRVYLRPGV